MPPSLFSRMATPSQFARVPRKTRCQPAWYCDSRDAPQLVAGWSQCRTGGYRRDAEGRSGIGPDGPFYSEILRYLDHMPSPDSTWPSPESNRALLLAKLDELLAILAVCANRHAIQHVESLRRHYRVLVSPLADLAELTESLLRMAAEVPNQEGPIRYEPFRPLLNIYVELHSRLKRFETEIPRDALSAIEFQISLLAKVLPDDLQDALGRIEQELDRLLESRSGQRMVRLHACGNHAVVWH